MKFGLATLLLIVTACAALFALLRLGPPQFTLILFVSAAIIVRLVAGRMDDGRIREYIQRRGGQLLATQWDPFGTGWLDGSSARIYDVRYRDREGNYRRATVKTSMLSGVYFTDDRIDYSIEAMQREKTECREGTR